MNTNNQTNSLTTMPQQVTYSHYMKVIEKCKNRSYNHLHIFLSDANKHRGDSCFAIISGIGVQSELIPISSGMGKILMRLIIGEKPNELEIRMPFWEAIKIKGKESAYAYASSNIIELFEMGIKMMNSFTEEFLLGNNYYYVWTGKRKDCRYKFGYRVEISIKYKGENISTLIRKGYKMDGNSLD